MKSEITTDMSPKIKQCIECIIDSLPGVLGVYLFGSAASGHMHENSDIDLAVYAEQKLDRLRLWDVFSEYARLNEERSGILADIRKRGSVYG